MIILSKKQIKWLEKHWIPNLTSEEKTQYIYSKGFHDIEFFTDFHLSSYKKDKKTQRAIKTPEFHREIWESMKEKDTLIIISRDHWKTTSEFFYLMHNIAYAIDPAILLVMPDGLGKEVIGKIRDEFEFNESIRAMFGRLVPTRIKSEQSKKWSSKELHFLHWPELETVAMGWAIRWKRPTLILSDDPQENKDVQNPQITDKFNNWFFTSVYNTLDDSGRCIVLWTVIGSLCFVNYLKNADKDFNVIEYQAIKDMKIKKLVKDKPYKLHWELFMWDGKKHIISWKPLWEDKWSIAALDRRYQKLQEKDWDDDKFMQEFQNEPLILNGKPFYPKEMLRLQSLTEPLKRDEIYEDLLIFWKPEENCLIWIDVAEWLLTGDYSVIRVRSRKTFNILASYRWHIDPDLLPEVIDRLYKLWFTGRIGIEKNNHWLTTIKACKAYDWFYDLYKERPIDKITNKPRDNYWFNTNLKTRPFMLDRHKTYYREQSIDVDKGLRDEMQVFYRNEKGRPEALQWSHDDLIMADAISLQMIEHPIIKKVIV